MRAQHRPATGAAGIAAAGQRGDAESGGRIGTDEGLFGNLRDEAPQSPQEHDEHREGGERSMPLPVLLREEGKENVRRGDDGNAGERRDEASAGSARRPAVLQTGAGRSRKTHEMFLEDLPE